MPKFSAFTPFGAFAFSSKPSRIETIYRAMVANLGDNYDMTPGTNVESFVYARARELARARYVLERAYNNANPLKATETLPDLENEFQVIPGADDTLPQRRAALSARAKLPGGASYANVTTALFTLLGSDFVSYRLTKANEATNFPATGGAEPANYVAPSTVLKNILITTGISVMGTQTVNFVPFDASNPVKLLTGDTLVVDPAILGITETVTVSAPTATAFTATFNKPHDPNVFATTQRYPFWSSTQRFSLIVVTQAAAQNQDTRRKIHDLMRRLARGVSTWAIVPKLDATHTANFIVDDPVYGMTDYAPIDGTTYP